MLRRTMITLAVVCCLSCSVGPKYPETRKLYHYDTYHGVKVADPYRWLEEDVRESSAVRDWVGAQNRVTDSYLEKIPERESIKTRLTTLWDYKKHGVPFKEGERYFIFKHNGVQDHAVLYTQATLNGPAKVLLDPNDWSDDGTVTLAGVSVSPDGRYLAHGIQDAGSDWRTWRVIDIETGKPLADKLQWLKFTDPSWTKNGEGFFYSRYPAPSAGEQYQSTNLNHQLFYHKVGTAQSKDRLIYATPERPQWRLYTDVTEDGRYLIIRASRGNGGRYRVFYQDLTRADAKSVTLIDNFEHDYQLVGSNGNILYFLTNHSAAKRRLVTIDLEQPAPAYWRDVIAENEHVLQSATLVGGKFIARYLRDARSEVKIYNADGPALRTLALPGIGSVVGFNGNSDDPETFFSYSSFNEPSVIYRYDVASGKRHKLHASTVAFNPDDYLVKQTFCASKDGTKVPLFIAHHKGVALNGNNPTLLYGYGGVNKSVPPSFAVSRLAWMEMGGVYAVANLRGGGEYGKEWHQAGVKLNKQNVFDDFIAAGECLVKERYTRPEKLAIVGRSNGGLLVGAVTNQRPDLFAAALPAVGVMDMLRFNQFTSGRFWVDEYGSVEKAEEFKALRAYSPYHNIKQDAQYPAVLVTTADTDDRVVPAHSFKYAAAMQAARAGAAPMLIRIDTRAGHGSGRPTKMIIDEYADRWAFLLHNLDMRLPDGYAVEGLRGH